MESRHNEYLFHLGTVEPDFHLALGRTIVTGHYDGKVYAVIIDVTSADTPAFITQKQSYTILVC